MQVDPVEAVDLFPDGGIRAFTCQHVLIKHGIGKAKLLLIILAAQAVRRRFVHQFPRQPEAVADLADFMDQKTGQRAEIACGIAVFGGISHVPPGRRPVSSARPRTALPYGALAAG